MCWERAEHKMSNPTTSIPSSSAPSRVITPKPSVSPDPRGGGFWLDTVLRVGYIRRAEQEKQKLKFDDDDDF